MWSGFSLCSHHSPLEAYYHHRQETPVLCFDSDGDGLSAYCLPSRDKGHRSPLIPAQTCSLRYLIYKVSTTPMTKGSQHSNCVSSRSSQGQALKATQSLGGCSPAFTQTRRACIKKGRLSLNATTVARPMAVRPTISSPCSFHAKCSPHR